MNFIKKYRAMLSLVIAVSLIFTLFSNNVFADATDSTPTYEIIRSDQDVVEMVGRYQGDELYATFDRYTREITLRAVENSSGLFRKANVTEYKVDVLEAEAGKLSAIVTDPTTNEEIKIEKGYTEDKVTAQIPLLVPILGVIGAALLEQLLAAGLAVVILGVTYVVASSIADKIKNNKADYYAATIYGGEVVVAGTIDYNTAWSRIGYGSGDVFSRTRELAASLAANAGSGYWVGPENHGNGTLTDGYYWHYHPWKPMAGHAHSFFLY
ncbi:hypothetical protein ['Paenibacillus yunnanensis' Narsing Rao et al. 2020]|uniref:hypothetical protein n=1 Tax=Paenibacillus tengchongensis TaxID=2608684 RepID=UPI00165292DB|nr:hypothetical protein [Paenibacillus tengchongensis]